MEVSNIGRPSNAKKRLVETALTLIRSHSYGSVSVDELCSEAGVTKSSFYHFFASKRDLTLAALDYFWQSFQEICLLPAFAAEIPPERRIPHHFDLIFEAQHRKWIECGHVLGCFGGNMAVEMSTQDEIIRARVASICDKWSTYFEQALREAIAQGALPDTLDPTATAQAILAYIEGVLLLAKSYNSPEVIARLRPGVLSLMHVEENRNYH
ncbi:TetR/AcrR family transcriptional regulator [Ktedonosporobacter rubrisoli]|uniref:TetR/AcrR family transcriptional regulator n=1 Tax=Ktedonosporobacter rubrisoli TaxID=2509675 RepID=A0A4V0YZ57_KTERU|nr:TetR/AcrR family transcriptional regulator [Ktedonosporobacter rubrisoli]QBD78561.1 TetR/AcrR family transcriptional regulator [Ktedonosporobacter rubrisoli]